MKIFLNEKAKQKWQHSIETFFAEQPHNHHTTHSFITSSNFGVDGTIKEIDNLISREQPKDVVACMVIAHTYVLLNGLYIDTLVLWYSYQNQYELVIHTIRPTTIHFDVIGVLQGVFPV